MSVPRYFVGFEAERVRRKQFVSDAVNSAVYGIGYALAVDVAVITAAHAELGEHIGNTVCARIEVDWRIMQKDNFFTLRRRALQ